MVKLADGALLSSSLGFANPRQSEAYGKFPDSPVQHLRSEHGTPSERRDAPTFEDASVKLSRMLSLT